MLLLDYLIIEKLKANHERFFKTHVTVFCGDSGVGKSREAQIIAQEYGDGSFYKPIVKDGGRDGIIMIIKILLLLMIIKDKFLILISYNY